MITVVVLLWLFTKCQVIINYNSGIAYNYISSTIVTKNTVFKAIQVKIDRLNQILRKSYGC